MTDATHRDVLAIPDFSRAELLALFDLAEQRFGLIERVNLHRAAFLDPTAARGERIGVAVARDHELGAIISNALGLGRRDTDPMP